MNKSKMMTVAVLACGLMLGACVEDKESASVENIRAAKAAQLNALAAFSNAEAEAKLIYANADKAIKEAEARLKAAEALIKELEAQAQDLEVQKLKATLELEIEAAELRAKADIERAKAELEAAKAELIAALDQVSEAEKTRLKTLIGNANTVLGEINTAQQNLTTAKFDKIAASYDLIDAGYVKDQGLAANTKVIATNEALIAEYKKYNQNDKLNAEKAADEAEAVAKGLKTVSDAATQESNKAAAAATAAKKIQNEGTFMYTVSNLGGNAYVTIVNTPSVKKEYTYDDGTYAVDNIPAFVTYTVKSTELSNAVSDASKKVIVASTALTEANKILAEKKKEAGYTAVQDELKAAQKAFNDATTSADKENARQRIQAAEQAVKMYTETEENAVKDATDALQNAQKASAELAAIQTALTGENADAYQAAIDAYQAAEVAATDARIAADKANHNYTVKNTLAVTLRGVAEGLTDFTKEISLLEQANNTLKQANDDLDRNVKTKEDLIAYLNKQIAHYEIEITAKQAMYDSYLAQINELIAE